MQHSYQLRTWKCKSNCGAVPCELISSIVDKPDLCLFEGHGNNPDWELESISETIFKCEEEI